MVKKRKSNPRPVHRIWTRDLQKVQRLLPPAETNGQSCWACGHTVHMTVFGWSRKLIEMHDAYGRLVMCQQCVKWHMEMLAQDCPVIYHPPKPPAELPTLEEWLAEATEEEIEAVLTRMKARRKEVK